MNLVFMITLIIFDGILLFLILRISKNKEPFDNELLSELSEERQLISNMHAKIKNELSSLQDKTKETFAKVTHIASEVDLEVKNCKKIMQSSAQSVADEIIKHFEDPLEKLTQKQTVLQSTTKQASQVIQQLNFVLKRAEKILLFLDDKTPHEEILKDIELQKYLKARKLVEKGYAPQQIADTVGLPIAEIRLMTD